LEKVGFQKVELIGETGFNSTPKTKGVLFRAEKPALSAKLVKPPANTEQSDRKVHPTVKKTPPAIDAVLEKAYAIVFQIKFLDCVISRPPFNNVLTVRLTQGGSF
jgi:hypothetical protein